MILVKQALGAIQIIRDTFLTSPPPFGMRRIECHALFECPSFPYSYHIWRLFHYLNLFYSGKKIYENFNLLYLFDQFLCFNGIITSEKYIGKQTRRANFPREAKKFLSKFFFSFAALKFLLSSVCNSDGSVTLWMQSPAYGWGRKYPRNSSYWKLCPFFLTLYIKFQ